MTRLRDKIPVEPLAEPQLANIERHLVGQASALPSRKRGSNPLRWLAPLTLATATAAVAFYVGTRVSSQSGGETAAQSVEMRPLTAGTIAIGRAKITTAAGTEAVVVPSTDGSIRVELASGRVDCEVEPAADRPPFVVRAGDVDVRVVGTVFAVQRQDDVQVSVTRGKVLVASNTGERAVAAGERWSEKDGVLALATPTDDTGGVVQVPTIVDRIKTQSPTSRPVAAGDRNGKSPDRDAGASSSTTVDDTTSALKSSRPSRRRPPSSSDGDIARLLEVEADDPAAAVREYARIARTKKGDVASYALYSQAYLSYFRLRRTRSALVALDLYERRFPRGREAESALWLRIRALCSRTDKSACRSAAHSYMRRYPSGKFAVLARKITNL